MSPVAIVITAVGVLCTILGLFGAAVWRLATRVQRSSDVSDQATKAIDALPDTLKGFNARLTEHDNKLELLADTMHKHTAVTNSLNRRVVALEFVIGQQDPDGLGIAQAAAQDEDSAVHWIGPKKKDGDNE